MGKPVTSCDNCRRSRLGCNAANSLPGHGCFNCSRQGVACTFRAVVTNANVKNHASSQISGRLPVTGTAAGSGPGMGAGMDAGIATDSNSSPSSIPFQAVMSETSDSLARSQQALRLHNLLWNVYSSLLEPRIGLWIGGAGSPFMSSTSTPAAARISRLMINLDKSAACRRRRATHGHSFMDSPSHSEYAADAVVNRALMHAVYAYSVRWLHLTDDKQYHDPQTRQHIHALKKDLSAALYAQAKQEMYTIMSRPSYRSVLALYLFSIIPTSSRNYGDNIDDLCLESSLSHQNYLNSKAQMPSSQRDAIADLLDRAAFSSTNIPLLQTDEPLDDVTQEFNSMSRLAFWFGVITDTTRSLTRCRPSVLLPGQAGESKVWAAVRQRTELFEHHFQTLRVLRTPFTDDQVMALLQHAYPLKTLVWAAITRVQDALVHQMSGISLAEAVDAARKESNNFEQTFGQLLCMCQRDFLLLNRTTQMCYTLLNIHFQVGNIILVDALPSNFVFIDQYLTPYDLRLFSCRGIVNALHLALQTRYVGANDTAVPNILLLDPYPDLMTNAIIRTGSSLLVLYTTQKLSAGSMVAMFQVVLAALEVLANISYIAAEAIPLLKERFESAGVDRVTSFKEDALHEAAVSITAPVDQELFDAEVLRQLEQYGTDPFLVDRLVEQSDDHASLVPLPTDKSDHFELGALSHDWTFDLCEERLDWNPGLDGFDEKIFQ